MITFDDAYKIAKELKENIDRCVETENAFVFSYTEDMFWDGGYGHTPVVVMKESGEAKDMAWYTHFAWAEKIGEIPIPKE